jgi:TRAP-type C4-dicarboxylate transport system permease small subunit
MPWWKWLAVGIVLLALMASAAAAYGCWRWAGATHALLARIEAARLPPSIARYDARETEGLPGVTSGPR